MKLFENKIGRPSNEIKKKRRNFIISVVIVIILLIAVGIYSLSGFNITDLKGTSNINRTKITLLKTPKYASYRSKIKTDVLSGYYYIYNPKVKNGRIRISKTNKGSSIGWILEKDVTEATNAVTMKSSKKTINYKKNEKVKIYKAKIYSTETTNKIKAKKSGNIYIYNPIVKNNRVRITNKANGKLIGWVNVSEITKYTTAETYTKYNKDSFFGMHCYTEESVLANKYNVAKNVKVGDRVVCEVVFETNVNDKVKQFDYTLTYGKGLKLAKVNKYDSVANGKNYSLTLKEPTSVHDSIGEFTFEVIGTEDLNYGMKNIKFETTANKKYSVDDKLYKFEKYPKYSNNPFAINCYTEESFLENKHYQTPKNVKVGDRVVCDISFETYVNDKVKQLDYTLSYGNGLKLVNVNKFDSVVKGNNYSLTLKKPTSVGEDVGRFTFEITDTKDMSYGMKNITFETSNGKVFSTSDLIYKFK